MHTSLLLGSSWQSGLVLYDFGTSLCAAPLRRKDSETVFLCVSAVVMQHRITDGFELRDQGCPGDGKGLLYDQSIETS